MALFSFFIIDSSFAGALVYSTYWGGGSFDEGSGITVDSSGSANIIEFTYSSDFPTTPGAFDTSYDGSASGWYSDVFVIKLSLVLPVSVNEGLRYEK